MRHNKSFNHLGRKKAHRDSLLANMTISLIMHKRIFTTLAKAKALRMYAELQNKYAITELFNTVAQKIGERQGGYTRILKTGNRLGDNAKTCFIELVDFNETYGNGKKADAPKTRRSRRSGKKADAPAAETPAAEAPAAE